MSAAIAIPDFKETGYVSSIAKIGGRNVPPGGGAAIVAISKLITTSPKVIVDIGCNTGWVTAELAKEFAGAVTYGIDISASMIAACKKRYEISDPPTNLRFVVGDCQELGRYVDRCNLIVSAGSTAFVDDLASFYSSVAVALDGGGKFIDLHYVYFSEVPLHLRKRERKELGVVHGCRRVQEVLAEYDETGLIVTRFQDLGAYSPPSALNLGVSILRDACPSLETHLSNIVGAQNLVAELSNHRTACLVVLSNVVDIDVLTVKASSDDEIAKCLRVLELFRAPVPRLPMAQISAFNPYELLAYIGDPDAAPGGGSSVNLLAKRLEEYGVPSSAAVLDVGSFTGLSTILLGRSFPKTVGIDIDPGFVETAQIIGTGLGAPVEFEVRDAIATGFGDSTFDVIVLTATLGYTPDPEGILKEMHRVLRAGGILVEFLYHYPNRSEELQRHLRETVSPFLKVGTLAQQVEMFAGIGFSLLDVELISGRQLSDDSLQEMADAIVAAESSENAHLSKSDIEDFRYIIERYVTSDVIASERPCAYLCVFKKFV